MRDKVAWWPQSMNPLKAGVRMRCLNPLKQLRTQGLPAELYHAERANQYRAVIVQAWAAFSTSQGHDPEHFLAEVGRLKQAGLRIVVDNCDNQFYNPRQDAAWHAQLQRLRRLLALADVLVCATEQLAAVTRAEGYTEKPLWVIGDAVEQQHDLLAGDPWFKRHLNPKRLGPYWALRELQHWVAQQRRHGRLPLVWFGNHGVAYAEGGMGDLLHWRAPLEALHHERPLALTIISNHEAKYRQLFADWSLPSRYMQWNRLTFLRALAAHHTALLPIGPNPFTLCKSNNRLTTALWNGVRVIADPLPSYVEFAPYAQVNGLDEAALQALRTADGREVLPSATRNYLREHWQIERIAQQWGSLIDSLL